MFDYHIHPNYSIDAEGEVEEFCQAALVAGLREIAFTTHLDTDRIAEDCYVNVKGKKVDIASGSWFEDYESTIRTAEDQFKDEGLQVLLGVEVDCFPGVQEVLPERFFSTEFDLVIGSVHLIDHIAISANGRAEEAFRKYSMDELGEKYYSILLDSIDLEIFDILAHIDLYRRYGEVFYGYAIHDLWKPHLEELSKKMLSKRIGFEVNTSSLRRGMQQPMPEERIIQALRNEGVDTVTVGSDAHTPMDIGKGIATVFEMLKEAGFDGPSIYRTRKPTLVPWSDIDVEKQN
ncbi:MAG: histidinol-phosphatase HisJ family protein [Promethearchaeota archaeon]